MRSYYDSKGNLVRQETLTQPAEPTQAHYDAKGDVIQHDYEKAASDAEKALEPARKTPAIAAVTQEQ